MTELDLEPRVEKLEKDLERLRKYFIVLTIALIVIAMSVLSL